MSKRRNYLMEFLSFITVLGASFIATQMERFVLHPYADPVAGTLFLIYFSATMGICFFVMGWLIPLNHSKDYIYDEQFFDEAPIQPSFWVRLYFRIPARMYSTAGIYAVAISIVGQPELTSWVRIGFPSWSGTVLGFMMIFSAWWLAWNKPNLVQYFVVFIPTLLYVGSVSIAVYNRLLPFSATAIFIWALTSTTFLVLSWRGQIWQNKMFLYQEQITSEAVKQFKAIVQSLKVENG